MRTYLHRRDFLAASTLATAGLLVGGRFSATAAPAEQPKFKTTPHKALIGAPSEETFKSWKAVGIEGMETRGETAWRKSSRDAARDHLLAERLGMRIHSVMFGWANVNDPNTGRVARDIDNIAAALEAAQGYGADVVLVVPCKIGGMAMPKPWEFDIRFDEKTGHLEQVVAGDNAKYKEYIEAHNHATDASRKAIERLLPVAERTGVVIAVENVWNNLWVKPELFAHFIGSFNSHWVQAYYDIANHVIYAPPEEWIRALGRLIVKVHAKDFRLNANGQGGNWVDIRDRGVNWPSVRAALDQIGYNGWMTLEGSERLSLEERGKRLDLILAGK
ncbi:MAG TPA: sugar phosphate isomerase/epimerase family protein [Thermoguttaceae bacterium]|nr:sugar phosphate isomerase/epimerase family protein [Thermoguttaceae bacterium]